PQRRLHGRDRGPHHRVGRDLLPAGPDPPPERAGCPDPVQPGSREGLRAPGPRHRAGRADAGEGVLMREIEVPMPKLSMTMEEGELIAWVKQEGDQVRAGEVICEVNSDKVEMEVESPADGT